MINHLVGLTLPHLSSPSDQSWLIFRQEDQYWAHSLLSDLLLRVFLYVLMSCKLAKYNTKLFYYLPLILVFQPLSQWVSAKCMELWSKVLYYRIHSGTQVLHPIWHHPRTNHAHNIHLQEILRHRRILVLFLSQKIRMKVCQ